MEDCTVYRQDTTRKGREISLHIENTLLPR